jgi:glutamate-1-semialdehyde 2,1-aminomutase
MTDGKVFKAGTLNANRVAMAAAYATLGILEEDGGKVYTYVYKIGEKLMAGLRDIIKRHQVEAIVQGYGPMFQIHFTPLERVRNYDDFCRSSKDVFFDFRTRMLPRGVYIRPAHFGELYVSAAHTAEDADKTLEAADEVMKEMKRDGAFSRSR